MKKILVFTVFVIPSITNYGSFSIERYPTAPCWRIQSTDHDSIDLTIRGYHTGTRLKIDKGDLLPKPTPEVRIAERCISGIPIAMKSILVDEKNTAFIVFASIARYHILICNQDHPDQINYVDLQSLRSASEDSELITKIKEAIKHDDDLQP